MLKTLIGSFAVAVAVAGFAPPARAAAANIVREAQDRAEIETLIWNYLQALDNLDAELYAASFTDDGSLCCVRNQVVKGRAQIRKLVQDQSQSHAQAVAKAKASGQVLPKAYHPLLALHIAFRDKDHAQVDSYWLSAQAEKPPSGAAKVNEVGRCVDAVVRVNGKWLIQSRNIFP